MRVRSNEEHDLATWVAQCRKGDARAWHALVDHFQGLVYSIPKRMGLNDEDAADVFQATFIALHRSLDRVVAVAALPKWLAVTAARESARLRRLHARLPLAEPDSQDSRGLDELIADEEATAEAQAIAACDSEIVRRAVQRLNERCARLLTALYLEADRSYQEISDRVGIPIGAIGPTRSRCLEKLRRMLEEVGYFDGFSDRS